MQWKRIFGTAGIGLGAVVWAAAQGAQGDWAYFALAGVLALATNLTIAEVLERQPKAATLNAARPTQIRQER